MIWELLVGPLHPSEPLHHACRNVGCVRPAPGHVEKMASNRHHRQVHALDPNRAGIFHSSKTHCPAGHPYDGENLYWRPDRPNQRMCRECVREAKRRWRLRKGMTPR